MLLAAKAVCSVFEKKKKQNKAAASIYSFTAGFKSQQGQNQ